MEKWGFYVLADRIISVWGNSYQRASFLGVDALADNKTLRQVAMIDSLKADENSGAIYYGFFTAHPKYNEKKEFLKRWRLRCLILKKKYE